MGESATAGAIEAGKIFVEIFAEDIGLQHGLHRANARMRSWAATISKIGLGAIAMGAAIVTPLVFAGVEAAEYGHRLENASIKTGLLVSEIAGLAYAASLSGSSIESLEVGIKKMQVTIAGAAAGSKKAVDALDSIGISVEQLEHLSPNEQFKLIADRIAALPDPMLRTAAAVKIFGRSGADLLPILTKGAAGIEEMQKKAEELGITLSAEMAESVADVGALLKSFTAQISAVKTVIGVAIASALRPLLTASQPIIASWIRWIGANQGLVKTLLYIGTGLLVVGGALVGLGVSTTLLLMLYGNLISLVATVGGAVIGVFTSMLSPMGLVIATVVGIAGAFAYLSGFGGDVLGYLGDLWTNLKETALASWGGIVAAVGAGDLALAGQIAWGALKLGFAEMVAFLQQTWSSLKTAVALTAFNMVYEVMGLWEVGVDGIARAWTTTIKLMSDVWAGFKSLLHSGWESTMNWFEDRWLDVMAKTQGLNRDDLARQANGDRAARAKDSNASEMAAAAQREADYKAQMEDLKRQHEAAMAGINKSSDDTGKVLTDGDQAKQEAIAAELQKKKDELQRLIDEAHRKKDEQDKNPLWILDKPSPDPAGLNSAKDAFESRGTFSGFNLASLSAGGTTDKIAEYTKRTADATERIADQDDEGSGNEWE